MSKLIRNSKSGSEWTYNDLKAYNIEVRNNNDEIDFFGGEIDKVSLNELPPSVLECYNVNELDTEDEGYDFMSYLDMAMDVKEKEESAVDDFAAELLKLMNYRGKGRIVRTRKDIDLFMCGKYTSAETDVCVLDKDKIFLLLQEDKTHISRDDPEPQLIAEAIAAFQYNNKKRDRELNKTPLASRIFPGITMVGTMPIFYKIRVTKELDEAIRLGEYPNEVSVVERFNPLIGIGRGLYAEIGMLDLDYRKKILKCFKLFREVMLNYAIED